MNVKLSLFEPLWAIIGLLLLDYYCRELFEVWSS